MKTIKHLNRVNSCKLNTNWQPLEYICRIAFPDLNRHLSWEIRKRCIVYAVCQHIELALAEPSVRINLFVTI